MQSSKEHTLFSVNPDRLCSPTVFLPTAPEKSLSLSLSLHSTMKSFITILLFLLLLLPQSHGIRLGKRLTFVKEDEAQQMDQVVEARSSNTRSAKADIDGAYEGVHHYSCENTQCEGKKRKLLINATATATATTYSSSSKGHGKLAAEFSASSSSTTEFVAGYHDDSIDIAEMDYSPAKRKPPIHN